VVDRGRPAETREESSARLISWSDSTDGRAYCSDILGLVPLTQRCSARNSLPSSPRPTWWTCRTTASTCG